MQMLVLGVRGTQRHTVCCVVLCCGVLCCGVLCCYAVASTHGQGYVSNLFFSQQNTRARALKLPRTRTRTQVTSLLFYLAHALPGTSVLALTLTLPLAVSDLKGLEALRKAGAT